MVEYDNVFLKRAIIDNKNISNEGVLVYVGLVICSRNRIDTLFTSLSGLEFMFKMNFNKTDKTFRNKIKIGLKNLIDNRIINIESQNKEFKPNDVLAIRLLNFEIDTKSERFIIANIKDLLSIAQCDESRLEHEKLMKYYLTLLSTVNNSTKIGFTPIEVLSNISNVNERTIIRTYNPLLEKMQIIYIHRINATMKYEDGTIRKLSNTYGRYSDREHIKTEAINFYSKTDKIKCDNLIDGDTARSIKQSYNSLVKKISNGYNPTEHEIEAMNDGIEIYNMKYKYTDMIRLDKIQFLL